jgi:DNA modification methylase
MSAVVLRGDAAHLPLADESVDLIVTSPPYFGQRDYRDGGESLRGQIGSEETPAEYIAALLRCTREWMRVLKPSGSLFVNLGDKYSQRIQVRRSSHQPGIFPGKFQEFGESWAERAAQGATRMPHQNVISDDGASVQEKSLMQLPARYSIGCTDQLGLILRRDNIWSKSSGMPESVTDRCATRHEYLFHFTKEPRYFAATDEIREPHLMRPQRRPNGHKQRPKLGALPAQTYSTSQRDEPGVDGHPLGALPGSVWEIPAAPLVVPDRIAHRRCCGGQPQPGCQDGLAHHAAFPPALPYKAILGWSPSGICVKCGQGRRPVAEREIVPLRPGDTPGRAGLNAETAHGADRRAGTHKLSLNTITGYACACPDATAATRPALIVDPFGGTGTTALVADVLGRTGISVDRSAGYCDIATWRTTDPAERARALGVPKPPPVPEGQGSLFDLEASA